MKCNACNRRVKDTMEGKLRHIVKYHPVQLLHRFLIPSEQGFIAIGRLFGSMTKKAFRIE